MKKLYLDPEMEFINITLLQDVLALSQDDPKYEETDDNEGEDFGDGDW